MAVCCPCVFHKETIILNVQTVVRRKKVLVLLLVDPLSFTAINQQVGQMRQRSREAEE
jgi:hypothetical protein